MPDTPTSWFFVYVVESPSAPDVYHGRSEREVLQQALSLACVHSASHCAISREAFCAALDIGLKYEIGRLAPLSPVLHISSHGDANGIQLSSGESVTWEELGGLLAPVNAALNNRLVISMSCCEGYSGIRMAMKADDSPLPFYALIGSSQKPVWSETAIAFAVFYHRLANGAHITEAVQAMNIATGCNQFHVEWAEESKKGYLEFLRSYNPFTAQQKLGAAATAREASELQKMKGVQFSQAAPAA
jgi:hypothetical protein